MMITVHKPPCCKICGYYLTTKEQYTRYRCVKPEHWQSAGLLAPRDFYSMARLVASARAELARRFIVEERSSSTYTASPTELGGRFGPVW